MVWATFWDQFTITLNGIQLKFCAMKFEEFSLEVTMVGLQRRLRESEAIKAVRATQSGV
jgi:hypothetical protein